MEQEKFSVTPWKTGDSNVAVVVDDKYLCSSSSEDLPRQVSVLRGSVLRGASQLDGVIIVTERSRVRPATEKDFEDFRVSAFGFCL